MATPNSFPLGYLGTDSVNPRETYYRRRNPTPTDNRPYKLGDRWINSTSAEAFILVSKTNSLAQWDLIGNSAGVLTQLTGSNAIPVVPVAGNISFQMNSGLSLTSGGPGLLIGTNLRDLSAFVVSRVPGESEYSSIQAAIDAAAPTGGLVIIQPGQYFEDLTLRDGVSLLGLIEPLDVNNAQRVGVFGSVTCAGGSVFTSVENIFFSAIAATPTFSEGLSVNLNFCATNCVFFNFSGADCLKVSMPLAGGATLMFYNCGLYSGNSAFVLGQNTNTYVTQSFLQPTVDAVNMSSLSSMQMEYTNVGGACVFAGNAAATFQFCKFLGGVASCFTQSAITTNCTVTTSTIESNAASTFFASGTGNFRVGNCALPGSAINIDPGLTSTVFTSI